VSYLQYVFDLDFAYQKERSCIIQTVCLSSRFCVSEIGKLHHTCSMVSIWIMCVWKTNRYHCSMIGTSCKRKIKINCIPIWVEEMEEIVSYMKPVIWVVGFVCIKPTINKLCLCHLLSHYILLILLMNKIIDFHWQNIFLLLLDKNNVWHLGLVAIMLFRHTNIVIYNLERDDLKMKVFTKICLLFNITFKIVFISI
jgi:hypothetical protein